MSSPSALIANGSASSSGSTWRSGPASTRRATDPVRGHQSFAGLVDGDDGRRRQLVHRLDDLPHDRRRDLRAVAGLFDDRDHDVLRVRVGREQRDEQRRVALARRPARYRSCPRPAPESSGKPWNAAYAVPCGSASTRALEAREHRGAHGRVERDVADRAGRHAADDLLPGVTTFSSTCGVHSVPPFANAAYAFASCSGVTTQVALADCGEDVVARVPGAVVVPAPASSCSSRRRRPDFHVGVGDAARCLVELDTRSACRSRAPRASFWMPSPRAGRRSFQTFQKSSPTV